MKTFSVFRSEVVRWHWEVKAESREQVEQVIREGRLSTSRIPDGDNIRGHAFESTMFEDLDPRDSQAMAIVEE